MPAHEQAHVIDMRIQDGTPSPTDTKRDNIPTDHFGGTFDDKSIRNSFIRKVYAILTVQLSVTMAFVAVFSLQ